MDPWSVNLLSRDFQLLCPQESRAEVTQYKQCNLARVPSHAVMVRANTNPHIIFGLLDKAQVGMLHSWEALQCDMRSPFYIV